MNLKNEDVSLLEHDQSYLLKNDGLIGVDEAGRGALAGPVMAAAVWIDRAFYKKHRHNPLILLIRDSKQISPKNRLAALEYLKSWQKEGNLYFAYAEGSVTEIEVGTIAYALRLAIRRSLEKLQTMVECVLPATPIKTETSPFHLAQSSQPTTAQQGQPCILLDGHPLRNFQYTHKSIIKGDQKSFCIAAASIVAKVKRDQLMERLSIHYPQYHLGENKGYGTQKHRESLGKYGPSDIHRHSFLTKIQAQFKQQQQSLEL